MIEASTIPAEELRFTARLIRDQALLRGWKVWFYYTGSSHMRLQRTDGKILEIYSATPPTTSYAAASRANDKYVTHISLQDAGLPVLATYLESTLQAAKYRAGEFIAQHKDFVIKPLNAGHGNGVTTNLTTIQDVPRAVAFAQEYSNSILLQEYIADAIDVRVACINYKAIASAVRIPARVKGDGVHSTRALIEVENKSNRRGKNYSKELCVINSDQAAFYLGDAIDDIPPKDTYVQVLGTANLGTGGETIDVTDDMPTWLCRMAEKAAIVTQLPSCGVDFLLNTMPKPTYTSDTLTVHIIEVNKCPALFLHETPTYGTPRATTATYLDYLAAL